MLNIKKYEKELRKYGTYFALTKEGKLVSCDGLCCRNCAFEPDCSIKRMNWLLEGYTEPVLTEEEKIIIKDIIKASEPFNKKPVYISKIECFSTVGECFLEIKYEDDRTNTPNFKYDELFKGMESRKEYSLKELGL